MLSSLVIFYNSDKIKMLNHDAVSLARPPSSFLIELSVCALPFGTSLKYFQHLMGAQVIYCFQGRDLNKWATPLLPNPARRSLSAFLWLIQMLTFYWKNMQRVHNLYKSVCHTYHLTDRQKMDVLDLSSAKIVCCVCFPSSYGQYSC